MKLILITLLYLFSIFLLHSCGQEQPLIGGPEDLSTPELVASVPKNMQTFFQEKKVSVLFDRYVSFANPKQNIIISPRQEIDPIFKISTKSLNITFEDKLLPNTTYIIQFGESVTSFREPKAITKNLKLVFSTGQEIDSSSIQGTTYDAHEGKPLAGVMIGLYNKLADSIPKTEKPIYYTKTDSLGQYSIDNISRGKYQIFALLDANKNLLYDNPKEKIGFTDTYIDIENNKDTLTGKDFWLFEQESKKQFVKDFKHEQMGKIDFFFNQPFREQEVKIETQPPVKFKPYWNKNKDSLRLWVSEVPEDNNVKFLFSSKKWDSIDPSSVRLIRVKSKKYADGEQLDVQLLTKKFSAIEGSPLLFEFNRPIQVVSLEKIKILSKDSVRLLPEQLTYKIDEQDPTLVGIYYPWKTGENYSLELFRNAFIDAYNQTHVILQSNFIVGEDKSSQLASITLKVDLSNISEQNKSPQYIVELLKSDKNIVVLDQKIIQDSENFVFDKMPEGNYRLRITMDKNKNARWDTGDYEEKIQPERIYYYPDEIVIKANFTQEIDWIIKL